MLDEVFARCGNGKKMHVAEAKGALTSFGQEGHDLARRLGKASTVRNARAHPDLGKLVRDIVKFLDKQCGVPVAKAAEAGLGLPLIPAFPALESVAADVKSVLKVGLEAAKTGEGWRLCCKLQYKMHV